MTEDSGSKRDLALEGTALDRLRAVVLLAGAIRPSRLKACIGRPVVELPVEPGRTILDIWSEEIELLAGRMDRDRLPVLVMLDGSAPWPTRTRESERVPIAVERDPLEYRGTGGVLRDLAESYANEDYILLGTATQMLLDPLQELARELAERRAAVTIMAHKDGSPSGLMLVNCGAVRVLPDVGFVDLKEQGLEMINREHPVRVVEREFPTGLSIRTRQGYVRALLTWHRRKEQVREADDPFAEGGLSTFRLVEDGAEVAEDARIHDSVVLAGGTVESGATVVRSVVCPGGRVRRRSSVVDTIVDSG
jgi:hypothetical protein